MKVGEQQKVILVLENGMKVRAVGVVTEGIEGDDSAFTLTIPNMHVSIQDKKLVASLKPKKGMSFWGMSDSLKVDAPLMELTGIPLDKDYRR